MIYTGCTCHAKGVGAYVMHYLWPHQPWGIAACSLWSRNLTSDPRRVTCRACKDTWQWRMADREEAVKGA
jgi:hypothetical protein